jgi:acyl-CoA-dependent ceramide synthase
LRILYSEFNEFQTVGPYELNWETEQYKCALSNWISTALLGSLQCLNIFWLYYILRIAYRFVFYNVAQDDRSDDEADEENEKQSIQATPTLTLNGSAIEASTTGSELYANGSARRKAN